jgi:hypothetical protein
MRLQNYFRLLKTFWPTTVASALLLTYFSCCEIGSKSAVEDELHTPQTELIRLGTHYEFPFGGMSTRPEWIPKGEADWRKDIAKIKETGLNSIRIRIGMDSDLDEVASLLDIIHENGLTVIFGFATFYVNDDFVEAYPDSKIIGNDGSVCPIDKYDLRWQRACIDHPEYLRQRNKIIEDCVIRFQNHPSIVVWDIHNEPSLGPLEDPCFCNNSLDKYRTALRKEFQVLEHLNNAFRTSFKDFDSIRPPSVKTDENEKFYFHWRAYMASDLNSFLLEGRDIVSRYLPDALITHNVTGFMDLRSKGQDWWLLNDYNLLTMSRYLGVNEHSVGASMSYEILKAMNPERPSWVTEFQGGPFPPPGPLTLYSGREVKIGLNSVLAHGHKGLYFYRWEPLLNKAEPMVNGMVEPDGYDTDRRLGLKEAISDLRPDMDLIARAKSIKPSVGIYMSRNQVLRSGNGDLESASQGAYQLLSDLGYEAGFIVHGTKGLDEYNTVVFPYITDLSDQELQDIETYIEQGGSAIIDLPSEDPETIDRFSEKFGLKTNNSEKLTYLIQHGWSLRGTGKGLGFSKNEFGGYSFNGRLFLEEKDAVLTYDDNGKTALALPSAYQGRLMLAGCRLFSSYGLSMHHKTRQLAGSFLSSFVEADIVLKGADKEFRPYLETRVLEDSESGQGVLFVINRSPFRPYSLTASVKGFKTVQIEVAPYDVSRVRLTKLE